MHARGPTLFLLLAVVAPSAPAGAQAPFNDTLIRPAAGEARAGGPWAAAFERARGSVVHVIVEVAGRNTFRLERPSSGVRIGDGTWVVTHDDLVREADGARDKSLWVQLADERRTRVPAEIVARDAPTGLALLRAELPEGIASGGLPLAAAPAPGDPVAVLGFHDGEDLVGFAGVSTPAAAGVVVGDGDDRRAFERTGILLTDAAIQTRSHGAALVDRDGALLGICSAVAVVEEVGEPTLEDLKRPSFGFAIPAAAILRAFGEQLGDERLQEKTPAAEARAVAGAADAVVAVFGGKGPRPEIGTDDPYAARRRPGVGSGVVVDPSGLVFTNLHLVDGAPGVTVTLPTGESFPAEVASRDRATNSALLRVHLPEERTLAALRRARSSALRVGDTVLAIGNPEGHSPTVGIGLQSAVRGSFVQTDAPMGNQNGGGALVTLRGELVAMLDAGVRDRIDLAYAMEGDRAKVDTSLNLAPSADALWDAHADALTRWSTGSSTAPAGDPVPSPVADLVDRTAGSMLNVYIEITTAAAEVADNPFATPEPRTITESLGSGVVVDPSGLALTNWHVVDSATEPDGSMRSDRVVRVGLRDGRVFPARVLSISREEDLALLQLELAPGESVDAVPLGSSAALRIGDSTVAIGNPHGRANTVTAGVVTAKNQAIRVRGRWAKLPYLLETDAAINAGNSGGALLDLEGRLIGINSAGGSLFAVTGYAISVDHVREKLHSVLLSPEKLRSPYVGVTVADRDGRTVVHSVDPFGPGASAGIERGDVVASIAGSPVQWSVGFAMTVLGLPTDQPTAFELARDGSRVTAEFTPMSAAAWAVLRQTGLHVEELAIREEPEVVRDASIAFHRAFSGDPTAAPSMIPAWLVRVARIHPRLADEDVDIRVGDLLLGVRIDERDAATGDAARVVRFERAADVQECFNTNSTYDGRTFHTWIWRDGEVVTVDLPAKRLML